MFGNGSTTPIAVDRAIIPPAQRIASSHRPRLPRSEVNCDGNRILGLVSPSSFGEHLEDLRRFTPLVINSGIGSPT